MYESHHSARNHFSAGSPPVAELTAQWPSTAEELRWTWNDSDESWTEDTSVGEAKKWWSITSNDDGTKLAAVVNGGSIWTLDTSEDSGAPWTEVTAFSGDNGLNWVSITSNAVGDKLAAVVSEGNIWTSADSGASWTEAVTDNSGATGPFNWASITSNDDGDMLAAVVSGGNIWTSVDSGATWTEQSYQGGTTWTSIAITSKAVDVDGPDDKHKLAAVGDGSGSGDYIYTSEDSGKLFSKADDTCDPGCDSLDERTDFEPQLWKSIASDENGSVLAAVVKNGNIWVKKSGSVWTEDTSVGETKNWRSITSDESGVKLAAVAYEGGIYTSKNSGSTWTLSL